MNEGPYEAFVKRREESEAEMTKATHELIDMDRQKKREIPDRLDKIILQNSQTKQATNNGWYHVFIKPIVIGVVVALIVWGIKVYFGI